MGSNDISLEVRARDTALGHAEETRSGLLEAQELLYRALRRPQPMRERRWAAAVSTALGRALEALRNYRLQVEGQQGLYAELLRDAPWAAPTVRQLGAQLNRIEAEAVDLQIEVARVEAGDFQAVHGIRGEAERVMLSLREALNREADLIYERFNEPAALD